MPADVINPDIAAVPADQQTPGPRLGFLEATAAAYDNQVRNQSMLGLQKAMSDADDENAATARAAGVSYTPLHAMPDNAPATGGVADAIDTTLGSIPGLGGVARTVSNTFRTDMSNQVYKGVAQAIMDKQDNYSTPEMREQDARINDLNLKTPGLNLKSMSQIYAGVQQQAQQAEARAALPKTFGGAVGGFIGGSVAGLDPRTDPLNAATLATPMEFESALARIGVQGGVQGLATGVNELTGVQENRRLLGLSTSPSDAWENVASAAVGGAAFQGFNEAGAAALRKAFTGKWFADSPHDPAPPIQPQPGPVQGPALSHLVESPFPERKAATAEDLADLLNTKHGYVRALSDLNNVAGQLDEWGADAPWKLSPPTDTSIPGMPADPTASVDLSPYVGVESKDSIARRIDPDTFAIYDKLAQQVQDARAQIEPPDLPKDAASIDSRDTIRDQIAQVEASMQNARGAKLAKLTSKLEDLKASVDPTTNTSASDEARSSLISADQQMRDLAPAVTRAYALADKKWTAYNEQKAQIDDMIANARPAVGDLMSKHLTALNDIHDIGPMPKELGPAQHVPEMASNVPHGDEPMVHTVQRAQEANAKIADDATASFQADVPKMLEPPDVKDAEGKVLAQQPDKNVLTMRDREGNEVSLHLDHDKLLMPDENGNMVSMSVRDALEEINKDNEMMKAVGSCSLPGTS